MSNPNDPYTYQGSEVLKNKLDIKDKTLWLETEHLFYRKRYLELTHNPIEGKFDYDHLKQIHGYIFQDMYTWAGKERTCNIAKQDLYCLPPYIEENARPLYDRLQQDHYLKGLTQEQFIQQGARYMGDIYAIHAFREGNTRSLCEFMRELAQDAGYQLDFAKIQHEQLRDACFASVIRRYDQLENIIQTCISPLDKEIQLKRNCVHDIMSYTKPRGIRPNTIMEYQIQAQKTIKKNHRWPGENADREIIKTLLTQGRKRTKIIEAIQLHSPEVAGQGMKLAKDYARKQVTEIAKTHQVHRGIER